MEPRLKEFVSWLESVPDYFVVSFCWDLFKYERGVTAAPVRWLEGSGRLTGNISRANVELAVSVEDEGSRGLASRYSYIEFSLKRMHRLVLISR